MEKVPPHTHLLGYFLTAGCLQLAKPLNFLWEKETISIAVLGDVTGVLCMSLYYQSLETLLVTLRLQKIIDLRLNQKR